MISLCYSVLEWVCVHCSTLLVPEVIHTTCDLLVAANVVVLASMLKSALRSFVYRLELDK